ncbi:mucin-5AC-like protein [Lates japonicus]|uniref:Mucin-5AC-like protein n=1 Tax=Lates japonicus TaxID=270547 RepID=A0AAD3MNN9_LATJO|nr:mucin-5AC-like protein [Lates japonicus]
MDDIPESMFAPERWLDDRYFPEITLLDVTRDSEPSPAAEKSSAEVKHNIPPVDIVKNTRPLSELSEKIVAEPGKLDKSEECTEESTLTSSVTHTISSIGEQSDNCVGENIMKASLEGTRDISMGSILENSGSSSEPSGQNMVNSQTSAEDTLGTHPANVTRDMSSSSDISVQCATSQISTSDVQCNTSSKNVTSELNVKPVETSNTVDANSEELLISHDAELTGQVPQQSPKSTQSANGTFSIVQLSNLSTTSDLNTTAQISCPQNKTLDLPSSNVNSPKAERSRQPNSGLPKPQPSGIPSGIQRTALGLRPPSARSNAPASSITDKQRGPTATNPVIKAPQAKKHTLRAEALPTAKRKKTDAPVPPSGSEASSSSSDALNRAKNLKAPTSGQRALPAKTQRDDAAVPVSTAETSTSCNAASRARALKQPASSHRALLVKPQGHDTPQDNFHKNVG